MKTSHDSEDHTSDLLAYQRDPYLRELETEVTASGHDENGIWVELGDTILYPEGGGQPADRGWIDAAPVIDVQRREDGIRHLVDQNPPPSDRVTIRLDWDLRYDRMQQHTGQHLLTAVALDQFGLRTTAFHLGPEVSDIELDRSPIPASTLRELEAAVATEIRAARAVQPHWVTPEAMAGLPVRTRGLPDGHSGLVRLVEIDGIDLNTCGGTHVRSTSELETVALLGTEPMRGGTRVHFLFGDRVRRRLVAHEHRNARLRDLLGAPDAELATVAELKLEQLKQVQRKERRLRERLAEMLASELTASRETVAICRLEAEQAELLRPLAARLAGSHGPAAFVLTADDGAFAVALGDSCMLEVGELGPVVAEILGGRGGGRNRLFQGKAEHPERLQAAATALRDALKG